MKPALARTVSETVPSKVLIAVDRSDSMSVADPQRSQLEKLELAKGLKLVRDIADDSTLDSWIKEAQRTVHAERQGEVRSSRRSRRRRTRHQIAGSLLDPDGANVFKAIGDKHLLDIIQFTQQTGDFPKDWAKLKPVFDELNAKPGGNAFTDIKQPLIRAIETRRQRRGETARHRRHHRRSTQLGPVAAQQGPRARPARRAGLHDRRRRQRPAPGRRHPFGEGDAADRLQERVHDRRGPRARQQSAAGKVKVTLTYPDRPGRQEARAARRRDRPRRHERPTPWSPSRPHGAAGNGDADGHRRTRPQRPERQAKDTRPENNTRPVVVNVSPDKAKVLLVDGEIRWEFHYLHTALVRDETMETTSVVFDQPRINAVTEDGAKKMGLPDLSLPKDPEALMGYDCIILGDVAARPGRQGRARATREVRLRSAAARWCCSPASVRCRWSSWRDGDPFRRCCRSRRRRSSRPTAGFRVTLTAEGQQTGFLRHGPERRA